MDALVRYLCYIFFFICSLNAFADTPACPNELCRLAADGAFDKFVVGEIVHVANESEFQTVLKAAKQQNYWQNLPDDFSIYAEAAQLISIKFSSTEPPVSLFMLRKEFNAAPLSVGDFVRYRPHNLEWEIPRSPAENALFAKLTGCIAQLCGVSDQDCAKQYKPGIYALDGSAYDLAGNLLPNISPINPETLKPIF